MYEYSRANVPAFYAQVTQAFAFLSTTYRFRLHAQRLDAVDDFRDTQARVVYLSDKVEIDILWGWASALIRVVFTELQSPSAPLQTSSAVDEPKGSARVIRLEDLAAIRGHADDPDFLLGDAFQHGGRITSKRFKLLQSDMAGVVAGLARATERYASDILRGDTAIFPDAMAYYDKKRHAMGF